MHTFTPLWPIWTVLLLHKKIQTFNTISKSILLYGLETWLVNKNNAHRLETFVIRCLRNISEIRWPEFLSIEHRWERTKRSIMDIMMIKTKWEWISQTLLKAAVKRH
ncbi:endonuclease-reverse transcriptase [Plakobranchus ocellatus]|uniref:Endonuclease-reverse transcriptase n=1 Tax=Plakobranchus ocellatus TaxID=259542 RepID=A0AAV4E276_9GAST|nr:endonuclease-reverse transcriptase [Plakobranchus ocellatus]